MEPKKTKHVPQRMCFICRKRSDKSAFIRFIKTDEGMLLDESMKANGRGVYICKDTNCINKAKRKMPEDLWNSIQSYSH